MRGRLIVVGCVLALLAVFGSAIALGALPFSADGTTIQGCYSSGGSLKVLTPSEPTCPKGYTPINWNVSGPPGEPGQAGPAGVASCPDTTVSGGTNDVNVSTSERSWGRLTEQVAPSRFTINTTFLCAGRLSNFQVTASGSPEGTIFLTSYIITVAFSDTSAQFECEIEHPSVSCTAEGPSWIDVNPGTEAEVVINPESSPVARSFDWSADLDPPISVYP